MNRFYKYRQWVVYLILFAIVTTPIFRVNWKDELITLNTLNNNPLLNPFYYGFTTNLPLYFILIKIASLWGIIQSTVFLRYISIFLSIITAVVGYKIAIKTLSKTTASIFLLIYLFAPIQIYYSQEIRPYALVQLLIAIHILLVTSYLNGKKYTFAILATSFAMLFTHLIALIYLFASTLTLLLLLMYNKKLNEELNFIAKYILFLLFGVASVYFVIINNPNFYDSVNQVKEFTPQRDLSSISLIFESANNGIVKTKEVLSFYYIYGLYYYRVPITFQFVFKKILLLFFAIGAIKMLTNKGLFKDKTKSFIAATFIFSIVTGTVLEVFSLYPFGGRHIMPLVTIYFLIVSYGFSLAYKGSKAIKIVLTCIFTIYLTTLIFHNTCANYLEKYRKSTPHSNSYSKCISDFKTTNTP